MKRDWDLLREQLTAIEDGLNVIVDIPDVPIWTDDLTWDKFDLLAKEQRARRAPYRSS